MNINHRGFLGSLLGTYVANQLPWYARLAQPRYGEFPPPRLSDFSPQRLQACKSRLILADGTLIKGPRLLEVATIGWRCETSHPCLDPDERDSIRFIFEPITMIARLSVRGIQVVDPSPDPISFPMSDFESGIWTLLPGDTLKVLFRTNMER